jgi:PAS domain S-box-containing protein
MVEKPTYEQLELKIRELEKRIKEDTSKKDYEKFLNFLPYPVLIRDATGKITYLNPAFTKTFGWTAGELKGKYGREYIPDSLQGELTEKIKDLPAHKNVIKLATKRITKDGKTLDVVLRAGIKRDENNNPEGMIIVLRDVTMEKRIKRNRSTMHRISQILPRYPDLKKLLFFVNTEIKKLLGTQSANTILLDEDQKQFYFLSATHDDPSTRARIEKARFSMDELLSGQVVKTGKPMIVNDLSKVQNRYRVRDQKIGYKVRNVILTPLRNKERIIGILAADNKKDGDFDETDLEMLNTIAAAVAISIENARVSRELRKAYEELKSINHAKDKMISHLAHELKTPVAILMSCVKILSKKLEQCPEKNWQPTLDRIKRNLDRIIGIEDEVYDIVENKAVFHQKVFSLILEQCRDELEALLAEEIGENDLVAKIGKKINEIFNPTALPAENISLSHFVEKRIQALQKDMAHRKITLIPRLKSASPVKIPAEPLRKTVDGLIRNAVENTPDGGKIEVIVHPKGRGVEFMVKDHGTGLTRDAQKRIFEGFFTTQETLNYSSKRPFDFNAGGKGADLLRMKIFSERFGFKISMVSHRCSHIPDSRDICPGSVESCPHAKEHSCDGMTIVTCFFPFN